MGVMHAAMATVVPGIEVAAVVDPAKKLGLQARGMGIDAPWFASLDEARAATQLDAVVLATPQFTHRALTEQALNAGWHVLTEKPLAHTLADAEAMAAAARERPELVCAIGFMKGHYPLWLEAARLVRDGAIGRPERFEASVELSQVFKPQKGWTFTKAKAGGGVLINTGVHLVHFLTMLFGGACEVVSAEGGPVHNLEVEDRLTAELQFANGPTGTYSADWSVPGHPTETTRVEITGDGGSMTITDSEIRVTGGETRRLHRSQFDRAAFNASPDYGGEGWHNQMEDFVAAIRESRPPRHGFDSGLDAQRLVDGIYRRLG